MENLKWKPIKDKPNYEVSNTGEIRNRKTGRILKKSFRKDGYCQVTLGRKTIPVYVHRAVADAFIPNPNKLPQVDHLNGDKADNRIENLKWVSATENYFGYGYENRIKNKKKPIFCKNEKTGETIKFDSRNAVAKYFKCDKSQIKYNYIYKKGNKKNWIFYLVEDIV